MADEKARGDKPKRYTIQVREATEWKDPDKYEEGEAKEFDSSSDARTMMETLATRHVIPELFEYRLVDREADAAKEAAKASAAKAAPPAKGAAKPAASAGARP